MGCRAGCYLPGVLMPLMPCRAAARSRAMPPTRRTLRSVLSLVAVAAAAGTAFFGVGQATATTAESTAPRSDKEIPNLDQVKSKIEAYYGDIETPDGEHYASPHSNYAKQTRR